MGTTDGRRCDPWRIVRGMCILATLVLAACPDPNGGAGNGAGSTDPRTVTV